MIFGWDISTSVVGLAVLDDDGKWVSSSYFDFATMAKGAKSLFDKMDECEWWIAEQLSKYPTGHHWHYFEDRLANFSFGKTMMQTLMTLSAFNCVFSYRVIQVHSGLLSENGGAIGHTHTHPSTVKAALKRDGLLIPKGSDKKVLTLHFVRRTVPAFPVEYGRTGKPKPFCYDMADAYIVARAGFLKRGVAKHAEPEEVDGDQADAGSGDPDEG